MEPGAEFAMTVGVVRMPRLCAECWDFLLVQPLQLVLVILGKEVEIFG